LGPTEGILLQEATEKEVKNRKLLKPTQLRSETAFPFINTVQRQRDLLERPYEVGIPEPIFSDLLFVDSKPELLLRRRLKA
jgi:hypothetical protein